MDPLNLMDPFAKVTTLIPTKKAFTLLDEFKRFAFKGNVIDLAVGVIIGAAFGKIVSSLVDNIIKPLISAMMPGTFDKEGKLIGAVGEMTINGQKIPYGQFLGDILYFLIVAAVLFVFIVKFLGWVMKSKAEEAKAPPSLTADQTLLSEIRDLLKDTGSPRFHQISQQSLLTEIRDLLKTK